MPRVSSGRHAGGGLLLAAASAVACAALFLSGGAFCLGSTPPLRGARGAAALRAGSSSSGSGGGSNIGTSALPPSSGSLICGALLAACAVGAASRVVRRVARDPAAPGIADDVSRRSLLAGAGAVPIAALATGALAAQVDVPDRINEDPYQLISMGDSDNAKEDKKEFYMKKKYREDTYQVLKHMKISGSLDKGTANMEKWNKRVKEEMNDWVALYRRQDLVVGRQSYYSLYSAINTLASHFTSYGPKFPFPSKRRARFYELINTTEKYLEKGK